MSFGDFIMVASDLEQRNAWQDSRRDDLQILANMVRDCAVFTFSRSANDRAGTRLGGLPYWRKDDPWPICAECKLPLVFQGQLDFRASMQPSNGNVLTFHYCESCRPGCSDDGGTSLLRWHGTYDDSDLIAEEYENEFEFPGHGPFYGTPCGAVDLPRKTDLSRPTADALGSALEVDQRVYLLLTLHGTKIGGYPPVNCSHPIDNTGTAKAFLASFGPLQPGRLGRRRPGQPPCGDFMFGDMGGVSIWTSEASANELAWTCGSL